jgi:N-acetyl-alpha-D-muramate 1-phosphate uridylyltransferase
MDDPYPLMLFAAGFGKRMLPLTKTAPKPLLKVAGRALIDYATDLARGEGAAPIVVNLHYLGHMIRTHLQSCPDFIFSDESECILETGGGLKRALPKLGAQVVLTLNTDAVWTGPNPLSTLRRHWDGSRMDALLMLVPHDEATGHPGAGDFAVAPDGRLSRGRTHVYTGAQMISADRVLAEASDVFSMNRVWDAAARDGRLFGVAHQGRWCDVGYPAAIGMAEAMLSKSSQ